MGVVAIEGSCWSYVSIDPADLEDETMADVLDGYERLDEAADAPDAWRFDPEAADG